MLGVGAPLLQACGGDDDDGDTDDGTRCHHGIGHRAPAVDRRGDRRRPEPEAGPLRIFNYPDYVNPDVVAAFEAKYGVKVEITTFDVDTEAITKLANGAVEVDLHHSAAPNSLDRLIAGGLLQPLNKSYLPNFANVLDSFNDPWYDPGAMYTVPYTVFSTGIGYRADRIDPAVVEAAGWDILWDPTYKGVTSILDDYREGLVDGDAAQAASPTSTPPTRPSSTRPAPTCVELTDLDEHQGQHRGLQGRPRGRHRPRPHVERRHARRRLLVPARGHRRLGARLVVPEPTASASSTTTAWRSRPTPRTRCSPTSTSTTCSTPPTPRQNFAWNGYLPPIKGLDADYLIGQGYVPENLRAAVLTDDIIAKGLRFEPLAARDRPALGGRVVEVHRRLTCQAATTT